MSKAKKSLLLIAYFLLLFFIIRMNSIAVVEWLDKSMFVDYIIDPEQKVNDSFYSGVSLIVAITVFIYSILGTSIVSILIVDLLMFGLVFANNVKVVERNEFITFSELQTITSPKELLSFVNVSVGSAVFIMITIILILAILQFLIRRVYKKVSFLIDRRIRIVLFVASLTIVVAIFVKPNYYNEHVLKYEETHNHNFNPLKRARKDGKPYAHSKTYLYG